MPRRAGERGAVDAGALPGLLPGGRTVTSADAADVAALWGALPERAGRDLDGILTAARDGELSALVVGAVDPADCPDPWLALDALDRVPFLVSLELRRSPVTDRADVVLPVAAAVEKAGTFLDWEGRARPFDAVLHRLGGLSDLRVLHVLADELDRPLGLPDVASARAEIARLGAVTTRPAGPAHDASPVPAPAAGEALLASWHWLLDDGSLHGRRAVPRGHGEEAAPAPVGGHGRRDRRRAGRRRHGQHRARQPHASAGRRRPARPGRVGADAHARRRRPSRPRGRAGQPRPDRRGSRSVPRHSRSDRMSTIALLAQDLLVQEVDDRQLPLTSFGNEPWWLTIGKALFVFVLLVLMTLFSIVFERKVVARMQQRSGPNRVGPGGWGQSLADGLKLAFKEDIIPALADRPVYLLAPVLSAVPAFLAFSVIPFGPKVSVAGNETALQLTDLPVGVLWVLACASLGVLGIVLAGWSSGSTYPLLGGLRSAAQVISYEIAMALALIAVLPVRRLAVDQRDRRGAERPLVRPHAAAVVRHLRHRHHR